MPEGITIAGLSPASRQAIAGSAMATAASLCWLLSISVLNRALMLALPVLILCYLLTREIT